MTKAELENAILLIADKCNNRKENYKSLIGSCGTVIPKFIQMIVYDMFIFELQLNEQSADVQNAYNLLLQAAKNLDEYGSLYGSVN